MHIIAPAKINVSLNILGKRSDGYHALSSCVGFVNHGDAITLTPANYIEIDVVGEFAEAAGDDADNLCVRAAKELQQALGHDAGVHIALNKQTPVGAGLGGGSSDAAAILRHLPEFWGIGCAPEVQMRIAKALGADVPVCLTPKGLWLMEGIGHDIAPLNMDVEDIFAVLVYPHAHTSTPAVYKAFSAVGSVSDATTLPNWQDMEQAWLWGALRDAKNDLQLPAITVTRQITEVMQELAHALPEPECVRMSGSGACCYALYKKRSQAESLASSLQQQHPTWWVQAANLL